MRRALLAALLTALLVPLLAVADRAPAPAAAVTTSDLALRGFGGMAFDRRTDRLFITQGDAGPLVVASDDGSLVRTVQRVRGGAEVVVDESAGKAYVARPGNRTISVVDTRTFRVRDLPTGELCPQDVAPIGDVVWFTHSCDRRLDDGTVHAVDTRSGAVTPAVEFEGHRSQINQPVVESSPAAPGVLVVLETGVSVAWMSVLEARRGPAGPVLRERAVLPDVFGGGLRSAAIRPDGRAVAVVPSGGLVQTFSLDDLHPVGPPYQPIRYTSMPIAFRHDGALAIGRTAYRPGEHTPQTIVGFGPGSASGYAWGDKLLYAVTRYEPPLSDVARYRLQIEHPRDPTSLRLEPDRLTIEHGQKIRFRLFLRTSSKRRLVTVHAVAPDGRRRLVVRRSVPRGGTTLVVSPSRNTTFVARYRGDDVAAPARVARAAVVRPLVRVRRLTPVRVFDEIGYARAGRVIWFRVKVRTHRQRGCLTAGFQLRHTVQWHVNHPVRCVPIDADGRMVLGMVVDRGSRPFVRRMIAWVKKSPAHRRSRSAIGDPVQFCPKRIPCATRRMTWADDGSAAGPRVRLVVRR